jgi:cobalamin-dependent methionine synthase I
MHKLSISHCEVPPHEVRRYLGYPDSVCVREDIHDIFQQVMEAGPALLEPAGCYEIFPIKSVTSSAVEVAGKIRFDSKDLALRHSRAKELAAFVVTVGPRLEEEAARLLQSGDALRGYMLDVFGSAAVNCLAHKVKKVIENDLRSKGYHAMTYGTCIGKKCRAYRDCGGAIIHGWSPGYGDWSVRENRKLLALLDGNQVGVSVGRSGMMSPQKSYVCVMPLGLDEEKSSDECVEWQEEWVQRGLEGRHGRPGVAALGTEGRAEGLPIRPLTRRP